MAWNAFQLTLIQEQNKNIEIMRLILTKKFDYEISHIFLVNTFKIIKIFGEGSSGGLWKAGGWSRQNCGYQNNRLVFFVIFIYQKNIPYKIVLPKQTANQAVHLHIL